MFNNSGVTLINSDQKHTIFENIYTPEIIQPGAYNINTLFGNMSALGFVRLDQVRKDGWLYWVQFTKNNGWGYPGNDMFLPGSIRIIRTSRNKAVQSGYLDVFDAGGNLIWSAQSASTMPQIKGFLEVAPSFPLESQIASVTPGFNPFFLWNSCFGELSDDGLTLGYSGNLIRWTGTQLQTTWIRRNQKSFSELFTGRGSLKIPYAKFQGYN